MSATFEATLPRRAPVAAPPARLALNTDGDGPPPTATALIAADRAHHGAFAPVSAAVSGRPSRLVVGR